MWIAVTWTVIVFGSGGAYYFFAYLPAQEQHQVELKKQELDMQERVEKAKLDQETQRELRAEKLQQDQQKKAQDDKNAQRYFLDTCLQASEQQYVVLWDRECATRGAAQDCQLPNSLSTDLNGYLKQLKDECFKRYPQDQGASGSSTAL